MSIVSFLDLYRRQGGIQRIKMSYKTIKSVKTLIQTYRIHPTSHIKA